jgi:metal-sulfur cluster biosynthetic enzyme
MRRPRNPCVARLLLQVAFMSEAQPDLEARALEALGSVLDPEVGMSIVELGLVVGGRPSTRRSGSSKRS